MIDPELLKILCCPESHQPLKPAEPALVADLNGKIQAGALRTRAGQLITQSCEGGLVREDGRFFYPIRQKIPILLINEAIALGPDSSA